MKDFRRAVSRSPLSKVAWSFRVGTCGAAIAAATILTVPASAAVVAPNAGGFAPLPPLAPATRYDIPTNVRFKQDAPKPFSNLFGSDATRLKLAGYMPRFEQAVSAASPDKPLGASIVAPQDLTIHAAPAPADTMVQNGDVVTHGDNMPGIATVSTGTTTITADSIATYGANSPGVSATGTGDIGIDVGATYTAGKSSIGIYATSSGGAVSVTGSSVITAGQFSSGVLASGHDVSVTESAILTHGANSLGVLAYGVGDGADVDVTNNGTIQTYGFAGAGIDAVSDGTVEIHNNGTIVTSGSVPSSFGITGNAKGIYAQAAGDVLIDGNGTIKTYGGSSPAIYADSSGGNISISQDKVYAIGRASGGIVASTVHTDYNTGNAIAGGDISIDVNDVLTASGPGTAIAAYGRGVDVTVNDGIKTYGSGALGIVAHSYSGDIGIHNDGAITTVGYGSTGITAVSNGGDITIDGGGAISAVGSDASGIRAYAYGGSISIDAGDIAARAAGIYAAALPAGTASGADIPAITINAGNVSTLASGKTAVGIAALNAIYGGAVSINADSVSTRGDSAAGIYGASNYGTVTITGGDVSTGGLYATGVIGDGSTVNIGVGNVSTDGDYSGGIYGAVSTSFAPGAANTLDISATSVSTAGNASYGVVARTGSGKATISVGDVSTQGDRSGGIYAHDTSFDAVDLSIAAGDISTAGDVSDGVQVLAGGSAPGTVSISTGSVTTAGDQSAGIRTTFSGYGDLTINASGPISTAGYESYGVFAAADDGNINISTGDISTTGDKAPAIVAYSYDGNVAVKSGAISTSGEGSVGVFVGTGANADINLGSLSSTGEGADGLDVTALNYTGNAAVAITTGDITTAGMNSRGVYLQSLTDTNTVKTGNIATSGDFADGVAVRAYYGGASVTTGDISLTGSGSFGVDSIAHDAQTITTGNITTTGDYSRGIRGMGGSSLTIDAGAIKTSGDGAEGVFAIGGDTAFAYNADGTITDPAGSKVSVTADSVTTTGANADGIAAQNYAGDIAVTVGNVSTTGDNAFGVVALATNNVSVDIGSGKSTGSVVTANGDGAVDVNVNGDLVSTGDSAINLTNGDGATTVTVADTGGVQGGGAVSDATPGSGDGIYINAGTGTASVVNDGSIGTAGNGYAVDIVRASGSIEGAAITNSGTITGAVSLTDGDDAVTNAGTFVATKDSQFGGGGDLFVNSGTVGFAKASAPAAVSFTGLETFRNTGGAINLANGTAGDTLTLPSDYVGSSGATLGLDLIDGKADKLLIGGAAIGSTEIVLATNGGASLLSQPVILVDAGAGTSSDAFTLALASSGFVQYGLSYDADGNTFDLTAQAGAPVYRLAKVDEGAEAIWTQSADAWSAHMAALRDQQSVTGSRLWGQAYGKVTNRDDSQSVGVPGSTTQTYQLDYRQDYFGGQLGYDLGNLGGASGAAFGITGGYVSSNMNFRGSASAVHFDTANAGVYAGFKAGPLFVNVLGQYDHFWASAHDSAMGWSGSFDGDAYGAKAEVGARFGSDRFFAEPLASIAWQRVDLGSLKALSQTLDFDNDTALTGKAGGRIGSTFDVGGGSTMVAYARGAYVHQFRDTGGLLFESGSLSQRIDGERLGDYGEAAIGIDIATTGPVSGFIEADGDFAGNVSGGGGRVGLRLKF